MEEASLKLEQMNNILQRLQHPLQCGICLHMLSSPITTKCNHSYCAICMDHLLKSSRGPVRCPLCLAPVTKRSLWLNDQVVNILSAVKQVIDSVKADCGFIASPRKNNVISAAKEISENSDEEMDEPRRGTRKRHFMPMYDSPMPFENERKSKRPHVPSYVDNDKVKLQEFPAAPSNRGRGRGRGRGTANKSQTTSQHVPVNSVAKWIESSSKLHFKVGVTYSQATEALLNDSESKASSEMSSSGSSSTVLFECKEKKNDAPDADCDDLPDSEMIDTRNTLNHKQTNKSNSSTSLKKSSDQKKVNAIDEYLNSKKFDSRSADTGSVDSLNKENLQDNANVGSKALNNTVNAGIENAAMPPPLAPLSRSVPNTRSTRQSNKNVQPGTNFRYASNMNRQLFEPVKTAATSIDVKDTKSPGWSHIVRAKRDLKNRHIGLNITGGDGKLNMLNNASVSKSLDEDNLISSVETQVFIDDQTQKAPPVVFDVEHLDMMPEKQGNVDKLRSMVKHFGSCDLKNTKIRQNVPNPNSVEVPGNSSNCNTSDEVTKSSDSKASDSKLSSKLSPEIHGVYEHVIADTLGTVDGRNSNDSKSLQSDKDHSSNSNITNENDKVSEHRKSESSHSSNSEPKSKFSNSVHKKVISYEEQEGEFPEYDIIPTVYKSKSCQAELLNCKASIGTQSVSHTEHVAVQTISASDFSCDKSVQTDVKNDSDDVENSQTEIYRPNICCKKLHSILRQCLSASPCMVCQTAIKLLKVLAEHSDLEHPHSESVKMNSLSSSVGEASHTSTAFPAVIPLPIDSTCQVTVTQTEPDKELDPSLSSTVILPPLSTIKGIPDEDIAKLCVKATSKSDESSSRITTRQKSKKDVKDVDLFATEKPKGKTLRAKADNKAFTIKRETSNSTRSFKRIRGTEPDSPDGKADKKFKQDVSDIASINDISSQRSYASTLSQKSSSIKKSATQDLAVCSQKSVESVAYEKNSEEMRLDEYDDKLFEYFGYKEKQQNDEIEEEDLPDLGGEEMNDANDNETDDIIPGTSEVLKNVTSDMKKIKAMRFAMEETIDISDTPASGSATNSVQTSNETVKAITECSKSISRVKSLLGSKRTSSKRGSSQSTTTSKGGSSQSTTTSKGRSCQSTSTSKGGTSHSATTTDKDDFSMISTQSDVISTQYQNKVRDEVEELQQEMAKLKKELADMSSVRDSESVLQQGGEKDMFAPSAEATEKGATADNEVTEKVFMCSLLKGSEFSQVVRLSESIDSSRVVRNFSPEVTHVIVKCDMDLVAERTLKFLYGVANGCYILDFSWVQESIKHNKLVDCLRYETFDSTGTNGPYKGRMNKGKLFQNTTFHFVPPFTEVQFDQLKELVSLCGGSSVNYMDEFLEVTNALCVIVMQVEDGDEDGRLKAVELGNRVGRVVVAYDWVIECIGMYSLVSLDNYLLSDIDPKALEASGVSKRMLQETQEL